MFIKFPKHRKKKSKNFRSFFLFVKPNRIVNKLTNIKIKRLSGLEGVRVLKNHESRRITKRINATFKIFSNKLNTSQTH